MNSIAPAQQLNKYKISRRGRKLQIFDDQRTLLALPKEVPERTWAEILQKEENDLIVFDIREELIEEALKIGYENYMAKQTTLFTAHIAAQAWLKLIDWHFYRHDPGEDPSAHPPCFIPKRVESWIPDELPDPSPKDTWSQQQLNVVEDTADEGVLQAITSNSSLEYPVVEDIPQEYWFPGKVNLPHLMVKDKIEISSSVEGRRRAATSEGRRTWEQGSGAVESSPSDALGADSELLQKVTDYSTETLSQKSSSVVQESAYSALKTTTPVDGSLHGAGDSTVVRPKRRPSDKSKSFSKPSMFARSRGALPPLDVGDSRSKMSVISDCRLRNLRLDTQYEVSSEKVDTPPGEMVKRK